MFKPVKAIREKAAQLLAADAASLAPAANGNKVYLAQEDFNDDEECILADIVDADFDGSTPVVLGTGTQTEGLQPGTNDALISLAVPAGGIRFETTGVTNLPQTIYGAALKDNAGAVLLATMRFETPITLTEANQVIMVDDAFLRLRANSMQ